MRSMPRHRAQRRGNASDRGVPGDHAPRRASQSRLQLERSVLRAMVTPWFAAGAGVLIAAAILLESPGRAVLSYGPPLDPGVTCRYQGCTAGPGGPGSQTTTQHGTKLHPSPARAAAAGHAGRPGHAARRSQVSSAGVTVSFSAHQHGQAGFVGIITLVSSRRSLGDWQLSFRVPGARIMAVQGAAWQPNQAQDGGMASWAGSGQGSSGRGPGGSGQDGSSQGGPEVVVHDGGQGGQAPGLTAQIVFFAVGAPPSGSLADCTLNGAGCVFGS